MSFLSFLAFVVLIGAIAACQFFVRLGVHRLIMPLVVRGMMRSQLFTTFNFTPWLFEPIAEQDLPRHHRTFFEAHTLEFLRLDFRPLGDFVLRRDPAPSCSRFFMSPCGTIIGALSHYLDERSISCKSLTLDGLYLETANTPIDWPPPIEHGLQFFVLKSNDPVAIVDFHRRKAAEAAVQRWSELSQIEPAKIQTVLNYGRGLSLRSLHQQGVLRELPDFLQEQLSASA